MIWRIIKNEFSEKIPSLSTIYKFISEMGLSFNERDQNRGHVKFERSKPNDLWQIDIAGVQTIGHLGKLYLIALLDDHSRFIVAAEYFRDQKGINVIKIIRDAVIRYGRPNQIIADNGTQFRNMIGELGTKYTRLLENLDIKPIFAKPNHPQTKGKLERWFGTVKQMFLCEARLKVKQNPSFSLTEFNLFFSKLVDWYNTEKPHRSLPENNPPAKRYFNSKNRIFRPLKVDVNWRRWLIPPGYSGTRIEIIEYEDKIELYYRDQLITSYPYNIPIKLKRKKRKITANGTIAYMGKYYSIDYKLAGKTVGVQEINAGKNLLVYLNGVLIKSLEL